MSERDALQSVVNRARDNGASAMDPRSMSQGEREGLQRIGNAVPNSVVQDLSKAAAAPVEAASRTESPAADSAPAGPAPSQPYERPAANEVTEDGTLANGGVPVAGEDKSAGPTNPEAEAKRDEFLREAAKNSQQNGLPPPPPGALAKPSKKADDGPEIVMPMVGAKTIVLAARQHNGPVKLLPVLGDDPPEKSEPIGGFEVAPRAARSSFQSVDVAPKAIERVASTQAGGFLVPDRVVKAPKRPPVRDPLATP